MNAAALNSTSVFAIGIDQTCLHQKSQEWMSSIDFLKDELQFFKRLLTLKEATIEDKNAHLKMVNHLETTLSDRLSQLRSDVVDFKKWLAKFSEEKDTPQIDFQQERLRLSKEVDVLRSEFESFKKNAFCHILKLYTSQGRARIV